LLEEKEDEIIFTNKRSDHIHIIWSNTYKLLWNSTLCNRTQRTSCSNEI